MEKEKQTKLNNIPVLAEPEHIANKEKMSESEYFFADISFESVPHRTQTEIDAALDEAIKKGRLLPKNPDHAVAKTLEANGLTRYDSKIPKASEFMADLSYLYPDGFVLRNYGSFAQDQDGRVCFTKMRVGPNWKEKALVDGKMKDIVRYNLRKEYEILKSLHTSGLDVPEPYSYSPPSDNEFGKAADYPFETMSIEAIPPEEGSTLPQEYWTPEIAKITANKLKSLDKPTSEIEMFAKKERRLSVELLLQRARLSGNDSYTEALANSIKEYKHIDEPVVSHGDTWTKNIIVKHDKSDIMLVDWELAGPGYRGQDAARTLWGLTLDSKWKFGEVGPTASSFIKEWCQTEDDSMSLKFGTMFESLRWIADRRDALDNKNIDPEEAQKIKQQIVEVKQQALKIIENIPNHKNVEVTDTSFGRSKSQLSKLSLMKCVNAQN